jgi:nitroreductase
MDPSDDDPLAGLLTRQSLGVRHLAEPGPGSADLERMAAAALRAPDHGQLLPFRFKVVRGVARARLAALFEQAARDAGKDEAQARVDAERARAAPVSVAVVARIDLGHTLVPAHEQWVAVGAALGNYLNAAHALGYAGKMLSGHKVRHAGVQAAFCERGETLLGWISLGTPRPGHKPRAARAQPSDVWQDWPGDAALDP